MLPWPIFHQQVSAISQKPSSLGVCFIQVSTEQKYLLSQQELINKKLVNYSLNEVSMKLNLIRLKNGQEMLYKSGIQSSRKMQESRAKNMKNGSVHCLTEKAISPRAEKISLLSPQSSKSKGLKISKHISTELNPAAVPKKSSNTSPSKNKRISTLSAETIKKIEEQIMSFKVSGTKFSINSNKRPSHPQRIKSQNIIESNIFQKSLLSTFIQSNCFTQELCRTTTCCSTDKEKNINKILQKMEVVSYEATQKKPSSLRQQTRNKKHVLHSPDQKVRKGNQPPSHKVKIINIMQDNEAECRIAHHIYSQYLPNSHKEKQQRIREKYLQRMIDYRKQKQIPIVSKNLLNLQEEKCKKSENKVYSGLDNRKQVITNYSFKKPPLQSLAKPTPILTDDYHIKGWESEEKQPK